MKSTVAKDRTKTDASYRSYPVPDEIQGKPAMLKESQDKNRELFGNTYHDSDYCFTWPAPCSKESRKIRDRIRERAKIGAKKETP